MSRSSRLALVGALATLISACGFVGGAKNSDWTQRSVTVNTSGETAVVPVESRPWRRAMVWLSVGGNIFNVPVSSAKNTRGSVTIAGAGGTFVVPVDPKPQLALVDSESRGSAEFEFRLDGYELAFTSSLESAASENSKRDTLSTISDVELRAMSATGPKLVAADGGSAESDGVRRRVAGYELTFTATLTSASVAALSLAEMKAISVAVLDTFAADEPTISDAANQTDTNGCDERLPQAACHYEHFMPTHSASGTVQYLPARREADVPILSLSSSLQIQSKFSFQ